MVIAHHLIWAAYGWWLPNDPRGSMSHEIRNDVIADLGAIHHGRKRIQPPSAEIPKFYEQASKHLKHNLLRFDRLQRDLLAECFAQTIATNQYTCYECAILPDHIHLPIRKHRHKAEQMIEQFQSDSRKRFRADHCRAVDHPVWGGPGWKVLLDEPREIARTIRYIELNSIKAHMPEQRWPFVKPYDNWPKHNSVTSAAYRTRRVGVA